MSLFGSISKTVQPFVKGFSNSNLLSTLGDLGTLAAPALGSYLSFKQQNALIDKQMAFQERMSNSGHQREVADLTAAGINPLYTATGGNGATTPMGSTGSQTDFANAFSTGIGTAVSRRLQKAMQQEQFKSMAYDNSLKHQQTQLNVLQQKKQMLENEYYPEFIKNQIQLLKDQGYAALSSGAASSANASFMQTQKMLLGFQHLLNSMDEEFLRNNPSLRGFASFLRTTLGSIPKIPNLH